MSNLLQFSNSFLENICQTLATQDGLPLLANYQLIPQLLCESIIDRAIATIDCTPAEIALACEQFYQRWNLATKEQQQMWRSHCGLNQTQFEAMATRSQRIEKRIPAQLDDQIRDRLLQEKFDAWLQEQVQQLSDRDKAWLGFVSASFAKASEATAA